MAALMTGRRKRIALVVALVLLVIGLGIWWFEPQALLLDDRVEEAAPAMASRAPAKMPSTGSPSGAVRGVAGHRFAGRAFVVEAEGGRRYLRLEDLAGDNGPDLVVYLSAAPASADAAAHDDDVVDLGRLKGNIGSSNYELPAEVDLKRYRTAVIWCRRFSVGFAVAALS